MTFDKLLVTGATGFIGSRMCELLSLEYRQPYRALVRNYSRASRIARFDVDMASGDLLDRASLTDALRGCDAVINLAHADDRTAARETRNLVEMSVRAKVKRFVHISSMAVHGPTPVDAEVTELSAIRRWREPYSDAKAYAEAVVVAAAQRGDLAAVILRPTIVYGPYSFFVTPIIDQARCGHISLIEGGRGICNTVYVDDVCDAVMAALRSEIASGEAFLVNGDCRLTWREFIMAFADMIPGGKIVHDCSLEEIAAHLRSHSPGTRDNLRALIRLVAAPSFHSQLATVPSLGKLIRKTKELIARNISAEHKSAIKLRFQGRRSTRGRESPAVRVPSQGRVIRESYRSRVSNEKAKRCLGWSPSHTFHQGTQRTETWLRYARFVKTSNLEPTDASHERVTRALSA
jgi:nucleoside-diphosphate-sugar epimerase